jgi:hypothetical protein
MPRLDYDNQSLGTVASRSRRLKHPRRHLRSIYSLKKTAPETGAVLCPLSNAADRRLSLNRKPYPIFLNLLNKNT